MPAGACGRRRGYARLARHTAPQGPAGRVDGSRHAEPLGGVMRAGTFTHGIRATYARGICRKSIAEGCPGHPKTGISCREAWRIARRDKERERRARLREEKI